MKKIFYVFLALLLGFNSAFAINVNPVKQYVDAGLIYTNASYPTDVAKENDSRKFCSTKDLSKLKKGESITSNYMQLVEIGDSSIQKAMKNGGIKKVCFVDKKIDKAYIPLFFFIPIYAKQTKTIVYGE